MDNSVLFTVIAFEIALGFFLIIWEETIFKNMYLINLYFNITGIAILWLAQFGNQSYRIIYKKPDDEAGVKRTIEFPAIWM